MPSTRWADSARTFLHQFSNSFFSFSLAFFCANRINQKIHIWWKQKITLMQSDCERNTISDWEHLVIGWENNYQKSDGILYVQRPTMKHYTLWVYMTQSPSKELRSHPQEKQKRRIMWIRNNTNYRAYLHFTKSQNLERDIRQPSFSLLPPHPLLLQHQPPLPLPMMWVHWFACTSWPYSLKCPKPCSPSGKPTLSWCQILGWMLLPPCIWKYTDNVQFQNARRQNEMFNLGLCKEDIVYHNNYLFQSICSNICM